MSVVAISLETLGDKSAVETVGTAANVSVVSTPTKLSDYSIEVNNVTTGIGGALIRGRSAAWAGVDLSLTDFYSGFHYSPATLPTSNYEYCAAVLNVAGGRKLYLAQNADGTLSIYNASNVLVATTTQVLAVGTWYWINFYVGTTAYELKINGTTALSGTVSMAVSNGAALFLGKYVNSNGQTSKFNFANAVIDNAAHPSEGYHKYATPTGNGTYTAWTGTYVDVDERPPNTTDYALSTSTIGDAETVNIADASTLRINSGDTIRCVAPLIAVRRDGASNGAVSGRFRSGSNFDATANSATSTAYLGLSQFYATDPNTSVSWTDAGFNAVEVGVVEASANKSRMTTAGAIVNFQINATAKVPRALLTSGRFI